MDRTPSAPSREASPLNSPPQPFPAVPLYTLKGGNGVIICRPFHGSFLSNCQADYIAGSQPLAPSKLQTRGNVPVNVTFSQGIPRTQKLAGLLILQHPSNALPVDLRQW